MPISESRPIQRPVVTVSFKFDTLRAEQGSYSLLDHTSRGVNVTDQLPQQHARPSEPKGRAAVAMSGGEIDDYLAAHARLAHGLWFLQHGEPFPSHGSYW